MMNPPTPSRQSGLSYANIMSGSTLRGLNARTRDRKARWPGSQDPENAVEDAAVIHPWHAAGLVGQHRLDGTPFLVGEFVAHDSRLQFGSLNHAPGGIINPR